MFTVTAWFLTPALGDRGRLAEHVITYGLALPSSSGGITVQGRVVSLRHPQPGRLPTGLAQENAPQTVRCLCHGLGLMP